MDMAFPEQPHDERTRRRNVQTAHVEAERLSVSEFDWISEGIGGMIDAAMAAVPHTHHRHEDEEEADQRRPF